MFKVQTIPSTEEEQTYAPGILFVFMFIFMFISRPFMLNT